MNLGIFVAFLFFFYGFSIKSASTRSKGLKRALGSKTIFLVLTLTVEGDNQALGCWDVYCLRRGRGCWLGVCCMKRVNQSQYLLMQNNFYVIINNIMPDSQIRFEDYRSNIDSTLIFSQRFDKQTAYNKNQEKYKYNEKSRSAQDIFYCFFIGVCVE